MTFFGSHVPSFAVSSSLPKGFVYLEEIDPSIDQNLEFATDNNVLGVPAEGYEGTRVICTRKAALALRKVQSEFKKMGLCLQVMDAYRPERAVKHIQRWARDLSDQKTKERYYPDISKKEILGTFVASKRSSHSRGSTFDVILLDDKTKKTIDLGPDMFGEVSFTYSSKITKEQQQNRLILREVMVRHGFKPYDKEFWHFTLINEPFSKTYFDFPVR